ncbi:MAG: hypothetical protein SVY15_01500 [Halobacteriota archaeon]|nr:hypothetical protein [Halobacteriota archaeon]
MLKGAILRVGIVISAIGMVYSGLMFLGLAPADLSIRFWDGGDTALNAAGVLDIFFGSIMSYLVIEILIKHEVNRTSRIAVVVCIAGLFSDWIGGLYGISALIGLISSFFISKE